MNRISIVVFFLLALSACGVKGPPLAPIPATPQASDREIERSSENESDSESTQKKSSKKKTSSSN